LPMFSRSHGVQTPSFGKKAVIGIANLSCQSI
jgi:hypothetical protein